MTVNSDLEIVRGAALTAAIARDPIVAHNFGEETMGSRLILSRSAIPPGVEYLGWHWAKARPFDQMVSQS